MTMNTRDNASRSMTTTGREGFTLLETVVAAALVLIIFFGIAAVQVRARTQMNLEQHRRMATGLMQAHVDGLRRTTDFDSLGDLDGAETDYTVDGVTYTVTQDIAIDQPEEHAATVDVTLTWSESVGGAPVPRTLQCSTIIARSMQ